jgi:hypothetical protein
VSESTLHSDSISWIVKRAAFSKPWSTFGHSLRAGLATQAPVNGAPANCDREGEATAGSVERTIWAHIAPNLARWSQLALVPPRPDLPLRRILIESEVAELIDETYRRRPGVAERARGLCLPTWINPKTVRAFECRELSRNFNVIACLTVIGTSALCRRRSKILCRSGRLSVNCQTMRCRGDIAETFCSILRLTRIVTTSLPGDLLGRVARSTHIWSRAKLLPGELGRYFD